MAMDVPPALNKELRELDALVISVIQIEELVFSRFPDKVKEWRIWRSTAASKASKLDHKPLGLCPSKP